MMRCVMRCGVWAPPPLGSGGSAMRALAISLLVTACGGSSDPVQPDNDPTVLEFVDHREIPSTFQNDGLEFGGTLYLPLGAGPFTTIVEHQGSSWTVRSTWADVGGLVTGSNVAFFSYDRRGHGASGGSSESLSMDDYAADLAAATRAAEGLTAWVRSDAIGLLGGSFGGWIVPLTANLLPQTVDFVLVGVGGAVSSGQEGLYDVLTGYDVCEPTGTPLDEITAQLREAGPSGFDPRESLEQMTQPTFWIFGGNDLSHPTDLSIENLEAINADGSKDWTVHVFPDANHELIAGGAICQKDGEPADFVTPMLAWLGERGLLP